jgi:hypothetical protein
MTTTWYFSSRVGNRSSRSGVVKGLAVGVFYHLGSLSSGALAVGLVRCMQWTLLIFQVVLPVLEMELERDPFRLAGRLAVLLALRLVAARYIRFKIDDQVYTDMALTSSSSHEACQRATWIRFRHGSLQRASGLFHPMKFMWCLLHSFVVGTGVYLALDLTPDALAGFLPVALMKDVQVVDSPAALGLWAALLCFVIVRRFSRVIDQVSNAVTYCFLWDAQDGTLDATQTPESFASLRAHLGL